MVKPIMVSDQEYKLLDLAREAIIHYGVRPLGDQVLGELKKNDIKIIRLGRGSIIALGAALILQAINKAKENGLYEDGSKDERK